MYGNLRRRQVEFVARKSNVRSNPRNNAQSSQPSSNTNSKGQSSDHDRTDDMFCSYYKKKLLETRIMHHDSSE